ncbi:heme-binding protein [uncultured Nostoc sp.]|uniref:GlcG/HbpS family heme-binding protein n=1 Tax=uncultured Nostoc sp. TaxID=340711 RepID=UPI00260FF32E|nr:heme-binding protein [uncultured Nostoc sp.]
MPWLSCETLLTDNTFADHDLISVFFLSCRHGRNPFELAIKLGITTAGQMTNLQGGLPIILDSQVVGAIGIGSGTGVQDVIVAQAGIDALSAVIAPKKSREETPSDVCDGLLYEKLRQRLRLTP